MNARRSPILIVGTGAMASLFAARLSRSGKPVMMLGTWNEGLKALQKYGVRMFDLDGTERSYPVQVATHPEECQEAHLALVLVKSWQTPRAAQDLKSCLAPDGLALTLQNGLGNYETLAFSLGSHRVALGTTTAGAYLREPGLVQPANNGSIALGSHPRVKALANIFREAGFIVETVPDPNVLLWGKLVINAAINPLTALLRVSNGELLERPAARSLMAAAAREAAAVAEAKGIHLPYPDPVISAETVARRTASNYSSMLQDVLRGMPTEIDAICGAIVRAAGETGIDTPVNRTLWQLVQALSTGQHNQLQFQIQVEKVLTGVS